MLIYSIVLSSPTQLHSHLLFIQRFRTESLLRGQESYCLVNVQAAVAFLANVDPRVLGLGDDLSR
jgi:phosphopantothenoylcysteine decarboxylase